MTQGPGASTYDRWREVVKIRQEWLDHGLSPAPADRPAAERALTGIYARTARPAPRFEWVDSPRQALPLIAGRPTLDDLYARIRDPRGTAPAASDLAVVGARLKAGLSAGTLHPDPELSPVRKKGKRDESWPELPPLRAFEAGVPPNVVLHQGVLGSLRRSLVRGFRQLLRDALGGGSLPVCWYGQHDAAWIAYYDALHRLGLARYRPDDLEHLELWSALARSCGWWWPGEDVCVVADRPEQVHTESLPGAFHDEVRLVAVHYRDGWKPL